MSKKVVPINSRPRKRKQPARPEELDQIARELAERYWNPDFLKTLDEPQGLASGKLSKSGTFVDEDDEDEDH